MWIVYLLQLSRSHHGVQSLTTLAYPCPPVLPARQGVAALVAMNILGNVEGLASQPWGGPARLHATIESMRLAFVDALQFNADPDVVHVPIDQLLDPAHAAQRHSEIMPDKVRASRASPVYGSCPAGVYLEGL